jgi:hypothetical protein
MNRRSLQVIRHPHCRSYEYLGPRKIVSRESELRLAEISSMKNKAGCEEEDCRVGRSVGDNQHQV